MESSDLGFHMSSESDSKGATVDTKSDMSEKRVNFRKGKSEKNIATMAHEFRHGYGYLNGEAVAGRDGIHDITDEVKCEKLFDLFPILENERVDKIRIESMYK